jgi:hypothetical protein
VNVFAENADSSDDIIIEKLVNDIKNNVYDGIFYKENRAANAIIYLTDSDDVFYAAKTEFRREISYFITSGNSYYSNKVDLMADEIEKSGNKCFLIMAIKNNQIMSSMMILSKNYKFNQVSEFCLITSILKRVGFIDINHFVKDDSELLSLSKRYFEKKINLLAVLGGLSAK